MSQKYLTDHLLFLAQKVCHILAGLSFDINSKYWKVMVLYETQIEAKSLNFDGIFEEYYRNELLLGN